MENSSQDRACPMCRSTGVENVVVEAEAEAEAAVNIGELVAAEVEAWVVRENVDAVCHSQDQSLGLDLNTGDDEEQGRILEHHLVHALDQRRPIDGDDLGVAAEGAAVLAVVDAPTVHARERSLMRVSTIA